MSIILSSGGNPSYPLNYCQLNAMLQITQEASKQVIIMTIDGDHNNLFQSTIQLSPYILILSEDKNKRLIHSNSILNLSQNPQRKEK
jgi:hypothetical protein